MHLSQLFNLDQIIIQGAGSLSNRGNSHTLQDWGSVTSTQEFHKNWIYQPHSLHVCMQKKTGAITDNTAQIPRTWLHDD